LQASNAGRGLSSNNHLYVKAGTVAWMRVLIVGSFIPCQLQSLSGLICQGSFLGESLLIFGRQNFPRDGGHGFARQAANFAFKLAEHAFMLAREAASRGN